MSIFCLLTSETLIESQGLSFKAQFHVFCLFSILIMLFLEFLEGHPLLGGGPSPSQRHSAAAVYTNPFCFGASGWIIFLQGLFFFLLCHVLYISALRSKLILSWPTSLLKTLFLLSKLGYMLLAGRCPPQRSLAPPGHRHHLLFVSQWLSLRSQPCPFLDKSLEVK